MKINLKKREYILLIGIGILFFLIPIFFTQIETGISFMKTGQIGDTIGGITAPFLSFFGSILIYLALKAQVEANATINKQFSVQKKIDYRQNFEVIFFNLLNNHHQIVENIDIEPKVFISNDDLNNYYYFNSQYNNDNNGIYAQMNKNTVHKSRDVFKLSYEILHNLLLDDLIFSQKIDQIYKKYYTIDNKKKFDNLTFSNIPITNKNQDSDVNTKFQSIYDEIYNILNVDYGHYFRNLYRIIKIIDERKFSKNQIKNFRIQYSYTSIIRSQLSDYELFWLFFNCISDKGGKFKPYLEKYTFLKLINPQSHLLNFYKDLYKNSAFVKPNQDKNSLTRHIQQFESHNI